NNSDIVRARGAMEGHLCPKQIRNDVLAVSQNKPKREVRFESRRNHSADGLAVFPPVFTANRRPRAADSFSVRARACGCVTHSQNEPGLAGLVHVYRTNPSTLRGRRKTNPDATSAHLN